jgi:hypothetical protein
MKNGFRFCLKNYQVLINYELILLKMSRMRNNFRESRKTQPLQKMNESPQRLNEVDTILSNLHSKLHGLENKYGDFVVY